MTPVIIPHKWQIASEWAVATAKQLTVFVADVNRALSGNLLLDGNSYADVVPVSFTMGATLPSVLVPTRRVTTPPIGLTAIKLVDTKDPNARLQVPQLTWHFNGKRPVIDALDPTTVAQLVNGHAYEMTVYVMGG